MTWGELAQESWEFDLPRPSSWWVREKKTADETTRGWIKVLWMYEIDWNSTGDVETKMALEVSFWGTILVFFLVLKQTSMSTFSCWIIIVIMYDKYLVGGLEHFLFFHMLEIIIPTDFHIFQRDRSTTNQYDNYIMTQWHFWVCIRECLPIQVDMDIAWTSQADTGGWALPKLSSHFVLIPLSRPLSG